MSAKFNAIRKLPNRVFHHEAITWNLNVLHSYKNEIIEGLNWLDKDLVSWSAELNNIDETINRYNEIFE